MFNHERSIIKSHVDRMFGDIAAERGQLCRNPVVGGDWLVGEDPITTQKDMAHRALVAQEWFYLHGPRDAPPLPLSGIEQEELRYHDPLGHLVAEYARSLEANGWNVNGHPSFEEFARGVLASKYAPEFTRNNEALRKRFPPKHLPGHGPGQIWRPEH